MSYVKHNPKTIVICVTALSHAGGQVLSGMMRFVAEVPGWNIRLMTFPQVATPELLYGFKSEKVDGLILSYCPSDDFRKAIHSLTIPIVAIDLFDIQGRNLSHIRTNQRMIGRLGAQHFLHLGRFASFGFLPFHADAPWSNERLTGFKSEMRRCGHAVSIFNNASDTLNRSTLNQWLARLKKPAAIMAANDALASEILSVAREIGIRVPQDLAVIGVDNDPTYCSIAHPHLTSVDPNFNQLGYLAAVEMDSLANARKHRNDKRKVIYSSPAIAIRESTHPLPPATSLIEKALRLINLEACHGLSAGLLARRLGVSPALLSLRFRERGKGSVRDAIADVKLKNVRLLLSTTNSPLHTIATSCGFKSVNRLSHVFKQKTGLSIRDFKKCNITNSPKSKNV